MVPVQATGAHRPFQTGCKAAGGIGDDDLMAAIADGVGAKTVPPGLVRRKRVRAAPKPAREPAMA